MVSGMLSVKQREFAHAYSASHNSAEAARAAGYSAGRARRTGYELLRKPDVAALVSTLDSEKREASGVDEPWVVDKLVAIVEASLQGRPRTNGLGEPIIDHRNGEPIIDTDFTNANRALATLSKIAGLQVHRSEVNVRTNVVYTLHLDRDLAAEAEEKGRKWG
jgi:hypothetical protein